MGWHDWFGIALLTGFVGPTVVLLAIGGIMELIQRKKADANATNGDSA
jgi:hypothetical protein